MAENQESYFDQGRVPSLDRQGSRVGIIPAEVKGFWKKRKSTLHLILIFILLAIPWTRFGGSQTVLLDIVHRKFTFFGVTLWAHEVPLIFFVLIISAIGLFLVTSVLGRVWCGWACPQTVFIEAIYRRLEILIEGNYIQRRNMKTNPWTAKIYFQKILKWISFFIASSLIAHSVAAYFIGSTELLHMMTDLPTHNLTYFTMISFITAVLLFDFGWFREQFCIIMCPYGRFQSALLDSQSMVVQYDVGRGEPRKGTQPANTPAGDCVSCSRCVQVCPTGIDIRYGLQLECIACTACMDACDEIMVKVKKPKGLIRYGTQNGQPVSWMRPRSLAYLAILLVAMTVFIVLLSQRAPVEIAILRGIEQPYQVVADDHGKTLINHFRIHIENQSGENIDYQIRLKDPSQSSQMELATVENPVHIGAGEDKMIHVFVKERSPFNLINGERKLEILVGEISKELNIMGPTHE